MGKYTDTDWEKIGRGQKKDVERNNNLVPEEDVQEAFKNPGTWVELPPRELTDRKSAGTAWTSEVRRGEKPYLPDSDNWDADVVRICSLPNGKAMFAFAIKYLGK